MQPSSNAPLTGSIPSSTNGYRRCAAFCRTAASIRRPNSPQIKSSSRELFLYYSPFLCLWGFRSGWSFCFSGVTLCLLSGVPSSLVRFGPGLMLMRNFLYRVGLLGMAIYLVQLIKAVKAKRRRSAVRRSSIQETTHDQDSERNSTRPFAERCVGFNVTGGRLHITPPDIGHQCLTAPPIAAGPGGEATTQRMRRIALGLNPAAQ